MPRKFEPSPLALAVLTLLHEEPMHPYRMQRLIRDRGKDQVIKVEQRKSLYQTINQLLRAGLITFQETEHQAGLPDRTLYQLTEQGHQTAVSWLRTMLATPAPEFPEFPAAISLMPLLTPDDALHQLELREARLLERLAQLAQEFQAQEPHLERLFLLESEYLHVILATELKWVRSILDDLRRGRLTWNHDWMQPKPKA